MSSSPYVIVQNDNGQVLQQWAFAGILMTGANNDKGRLYASFAAAGGTLTVTVYKDVARQNAVCSGTTDDDGEDVTIALSALNDSGITGSVVLKGYTEGGDDSNIILYPFLSIDDDLDEEEDDFANWRASGDSDLEKANTKTMKDFYRKMLNRMPPLTSGVGTQADTHPWLKNLLGQYECHKLHNVEMYREWAIAQTIAHLYEGHETEAEGAVFLLGEKRQKKADRIWKEINPMLDIDSDTSLDRTITSRRISRG